MARGKNKANRTPMEEVYNSLKSINQNIRRMERGGKQQNDIDAYINRQKKDLGKIGESLFSKGKGNLFSQGVKQIEKSIKELEDYRDDLDNGKRFVDRKINELKGRLGTSKEKGYNQPKKFEEFRQNKSKEFFDHVNSNPKLKQYYKVNDNLSISEKNRIFEKFIEDMDSLRQDREMKDLISDVVLARAYEEVTPNSITKRDVEEVINMNVRKERFLSQFKGGKI